MRIAHGFSKPVTHDWSPFHGGEELAALRDATGKGASKT